jgi:hypothetical protein
MVDGHLVGLEVGLMLVSWSMVSWLVWSWLIGGLMV